MKKFTLFTFLATAFVSGVILMSSCTKEGPMGQTGAQGPQGPAGEDGINGTDGTAGCIECHDGGESQGMFAQTVQWEASVHATGGNFDRSTFADCGTCHTSQGFLANLAGTFSNPINNPNPINCYTCHNIHDTYTPADLALTTTAAVTTMQGGEVFDFGKGNLCANCHQARTVSPMPVEDGDDVTITSFRFGGHHGPQANIFIGSGLVEFSGTESYGTNHQHGTSAMTDGCVSCHMQNATGAKAGGHTMSMRADDHGELVLYTNMCADCHGTEDMEQVTEDFQAEIQDLLDQLKDALITAGVYDDGTHGHEGYVVTGVQPANAAAAFLNYQMVLEDRSLGVHNPIYVKALLKNTLAKITP